MSEPPTCVNVYIQGNRLRILRRDERGELVESRAPAEYALFVRKKDAHVLRPFDNRRTIKDEGDFVRMICASYEERQKLVSGYREGKIHKPGYFQEKNVETFEADLSPVKRWLIDSRAKVQKPIAGYLDLENDSRVPFERKGEARMLCWGLCVPKPDGTVDEVGSVLSEWSDAAEKQLIKDLFVELCAVDQILAWNGDRFDFEYLKERIQRLGLDIDIRRWLLCDHMELFAKLNTGSESGDEKASVALDRVAAAQKVPGKLRQCGVGPLEGVRVGGAKTYEFWAAGGKNRELLLDYCIEDAATMYRIEQKSGWVDVLSKIAETCGVLPDSRGFRGVNYVESFLMRLGAERGVRAPTKIYEDNTWEEHEKFRGAHVFPTKTGLFRSVHICDFSRLYPSIMQAWNMSPETWLGPALKPDGEPATTLEEAVLDLKEGEAVAPITLQKFRVEGERGLLALAVDRMVEQRKFWSKKKKAAEPGSPEWIHCNRMDQGWKALVNTLYGVIGSIFSRFFKKEIAESVTQTGVWLIKMVVEQAAARHGLTAIAGDSVTADRILVVKDPRGHVKMLSAENLWGHVGGSIKREAGKEVREAPGWLALARGESDGWFPLERVIRHRSGKDTWLLTTKHGQTHVTTDHSIMVDGMEMKPEEFLSNAARFTTLDALDEEPVDKIDLWEYVKDYEDWYFNRSVEHRTKFVADGDWIRTVGHGGSSKVKIKRYYEAGSEEFHALVRLIGVYVGDGSASTRATSCRYLLSFCKSKKETMELVAADLRKIAVGMEVFGPYWSDTVFVTRSGTRDLACLFAALCGQKSRGKKLPPFIFALGDEERQIFIDSLASADGFVNDNGRLEYSSNSAELMAGVSYVFSQHGMQHAWSYRDAKGAWRLRESSLSSKAYSIKARKFESVANEYVYDLSVAGAHTFVDGIGRVLLHNTDSGFLSKPGFTKEEFKAFIDWCNAELFPRSITPTRGRYEFISLSYEKEFALMISCVKKTYAGRLEHMEMKPVSQDKAPTIKGLEYKRGDSAKLARDLQEEVVRTILMIGKPLPDDYPIEPKDLEAIVERCQLEVLGGQFPFEEAVIAQAMKKNVEHYGGTKPDGSVLPVPGHVRVAKVLKERGFPIYAGVKIEYVVADGSVSPQKLMAAVDATLEDVDLVHLWESEVWPATERVLSVCFPHHKWDRWGAVRPISKGPKKVLAGQKGFGFGERTPLPKKRERKTMLI